VSERKGRVRLPERKKEIEKKSKKLI